MKMKKLFALMLALCLLCACTALAENEITWEQVAPMLEANGITGEWVTFDEIAVKIFVPAGLTAVELAEEDKDNGYIGYFTAEDGEAIAVMYVNADGMDLETYAAQVGEAGGTEIEAGTVNGLPCISYEFNGNMCCSFTTQMGYILEVTVGPLADDTAKLGASAILASIQAAE